MVTTHCNKKKGAAIYIEIDVINVGTESKSQIYNMLYLHISLP